MRKHEIEQLIRSLGIGATYRGYHYLVYGVSLWLQIVSINIFFVQFAFYVAPIRL